MPRDTIWTLPDLGLVGQNQSHLHFTLIQYRQIEHYHPPAIHLTVRGSYPVVIKRNHPPAIHLTVRGSYPVVIKRNHSLAIHLTVRGSYPVVIKRNHPLAIYLIVRGVVRATCHSVSV